MNIKSMVPRLRGRTPGKPLAFIAMALFMGLAWTATAHASTAANTTIRNEVTVHYADAGGNAQVDLTAEVSFTVALVVSTPNLSIPIDQAIYSSQTATYEYFITSTANGPDTYALSEVSLSESAGITTGTSSVEINGGDLTIDLGSTTVATATTIITGANTTIDVPSDDTDDGLVNGIDSGDVVVIGGNNFNVVSVFDNFGVGISQITVAPGTAEQIVSVGEIIGELGSFLVVVTPGTVTDATVNQTITLNISAQDDAGADSAANVETITTITGLTLTVTKYVRNVSTGDAGTGTAINVDGADYYLTGVSGAPGETMEYLVQIANGAGGCTATGLIIEDQIPQFTTYVTGSMALDPGTGTFIVLDENDNGGDAGEFDDTVPATVFIYAGSLPGGVLPNDGGPGYGNGTGGELSGGSTTYGRFQVTIDN